MIVIWHIINLDTTFDYNIYLSNFLAFIRILRFGPSLRSQEFWGLLISTTHLSISKTHLLMTLDYHGSYGRNKDNAGSSIMWKYRQFFAIPQRQVKIEKKENCNITTTNLLCMRPRKLVYCFMAPARAIYYMTYFVIQNFSLWVVLIGLVPC